ncbi:MAG: DUF2153 family protein [Sulfolobales archaeon]
MAQYFLSNLDEWVNMQKRTAELFKSIDQEIKRKGDALDRLELILATRAAFQHMSRTIKAFDQWLQDPLILANLDKQSLLEVWNATFNMLQALLELDIKHTSMFREYADKMLREGKVNPLTMLTMARSGASEDVGRERRTPPPSITM